MRPGDDGRLDRQRLREQVAVTARRMAADGLVVGTSGNVSARTGHTIAVTPTGVDYHDMRAEQIVLCDLDGRIVGGDLVPTSELPLHLALYAHSPPENAPVHAVVHTHPVHATAVSTLVDEVPAVHYMLASCGGPVRVAPYARYGTAELAEAVRTALRGRTGCLMRNHGAVTTGDSLEAAYARTRTLEWCCQVWLTARASGTPQLLDEQELHAVATALRSYGQPVDAYVGEDAR